MSVSDGSATGDAQRPVADEAMSGPAQIERLKRAAQAANVLCEVLWETLHTGLAVHPQPQDAPHAEGAPTQHTAELAERLADVAATVALLASADRRATAVTKPGLAETAPAAAATAPRAVAQARSEAVLMDERDEHVGERGPGRLPGASTRPHQPPPEAHPRPWDASAADPSRAIHTSSQEEMLAQDERDKPAAWVDLIASAVERFEKDRLPFAVFVIDVVELGPLQSGLRLAELPGLMRRVESASTQALEAIGATSAASLALEGPARFWLQVPETNRLGARKLVERLMGVLEHVGPAARRADPTERYFAALSAHTPPSSARQKDAPLELAIGTAVCPIDGQDVAALVKHASVELAAMRGVKRSTVALGEPS
jgi:hypothetical protein